MQAPATLVKTNIRSFIGGSLLGRAVMNTLSPGIDKGLSILIYHRVLPHKDPLFPSEIDRNEFDLQIRLLKSCFNVIPLIDAVRGLREGTLPPRAACITFDDGYADNCEIALPVLQANQVSATFFIATGFLNGGLMWNDAVIETVRNAAQRQIDASSIGLGLHDLGSIEQGQQAIRKLIGALKYLPFDERAEQVKRLCELAGAPLPGNLMMTSEQVKRLHTAGMGIGGHTVRHPILARLTADEAGREIAEGKDSLEKIIGAPVPLFAYPNGKPGADYSREHVEIVKALKFEGAVSTAWGAQAGKPDLYQLPRFTPWDKTPVRFTVRMAKNLLTRADVA